MNSSLVKGEVCEGVFKLNIPFILRGRKKLPTEEKPSPDHEFDRNRQIWIHRPSGLPVIDVVRRSLAGTSLGETTITETKEGTDQREIATALGSQFGETSFTKTNEGTDATEATLMSSFGETTYSASQEGTDQGESPRHKTDSEEIFRDEGSANQGSNKRVTSLVPPYSHF